MTNDAAIKDSIGKFAHSIDHVERAILFGSRARGDARPDSDWDILVLLNLPSLSLYDQLSVVHRFYDLGLENESYKRR